MAFIITMPKMAFLQLFTLPIRNFIMNIVVELHLDFDNKFNNNEKNIITLSFNDNCIFKYNKKF